MRRATRDRTRRRRGGVASDGDHRWQVVIVLLLVAGVTLSLLGARAWQRKVAAADRSAFKARAGDLAITVGSGLSRDTDFVASLGALVASSPNLVNAQFDRAIDTVDPARRYPGGVGYAYFQSVPASELPSFEARLLADPPGGVVMAGYAVTPSGSRASYCLLRFTRAVASSPSYPAGLDLCAPGTLPPDGPLMRASIPQFDVTLIPGGTVAIVAPVYRGGITPATAAGRQTAFAGWMAATFASSGLLPAPAAHIGLHVRVLFKNPGDALVTVAESGPLPPGQLSTQRLAVEADGPWTVEISGVAADARSSWTQAGVVLAAGLLLCGTVFAFVQLLALSRRRALRLLDERTGQLHHQALHDALTGLPNRALILDRAEQMLARGRRDHLPVAALFIDLDGLKEVNDTYGHAAGDQLLRAVAGRISSALRARDTVGRLGGDEFVVLVDGLDAEPTMVAERLLAVIGEPYLLDQASRMSVTTKASIGIAIGERDNAGDLLRDADVALYQAKDAGGDRYALFAPGMQTAALDRAQLTSQLRGASERNELFLAYQPTFNLTDMTVTGVEALVRWRHPTRGIVPPAELIPIAEDSGLMMQIGRWVLDTACAEAATWQSPTRRLSVSVNISATQLDTDGIIDDVRHALTGSGLPSALLSLEVTEATLTRTAAAGAVRLRALKALGVKIAIDDFGTGYSSLAYLRQIPADAIKIDRSFVAGIADSPDNAVILRTLVQVGKSLGIETLAEGIEEREQLRHLQAEDCDSGQGFLFARPLTPQAIRSLITPSLAAALAPAAPTAAAEITSGATK